MVENLGLILL